MATTTATLDLPIWRNDDVYELPLRVIGPNLTGVPIRAQIRRAGDEPGPALVSLELVAAGEGIRLASVTSIDGVWQNDLRIRISTATRQALGYAGVPGASQMLRWGLKIAGITRIQGQVILPPHVMDSDSAPEVFDDPYGYARQAEVFSAPIDGATLTIAADNVVQLTIDGADLVERAAGLSKDSADRSEANRAITAAEAIKAALSASTALTAIGGVMYSSKVAGLAATGMPRFFTVVGDNASTYAILYERSRGLTYDFTSGGPTGASVTRAAGPWSRRGESGALVKGTAANVARFDYDPPVENRIAYANTAKTAYRSNATMTVTDASGETKYDTSAIPANGYAFEYYLEPADYAGVYSVDLRGNTGGEVIYLLAQSNGGSVVASRRVVLTTAYQRFELPATGARYWGFGVRTDAGVEPTPQATPAQIYFARRRQLNGGTVGLAYADTTGTAIYVPPVCRGIMLEPERTNYLTNSEAVDLWGGSTLSATVFVNIATAPDGTATADGLTILADGYRYSTTATLPSSGNAVGSWYTRGNSPRARFRLDDTSTGLATELISALNSSWVRTSLTFAASQTLRFGFNQQGVGGGVVADVWGAQIEKGAVASSYIPTTTAAATRPGETLALAVKMPAGPADVLLTYADGTTETRTGTVAANVLTLPASSVPRVVRTAYVAESEIDNATATERARYASKAAYEGAGGAALIGTNRGALDRRLDSLALYARDFGVVGDAASDANGNIIGTDDTAAVQAFQNLCAALNRIAYYGSLRPRLTGPVTIHNGSCVFDRQSFTATGESAGVSRGEPAFYVSGANYTALTVSGICTEFRVTVCGSGDATTDAAGNITADTRPNIRAFQFGNPLGAANGTLILSHIGWARATKLAGKALAVVNAFDCIFGPLLTEGCGNAADYGFAIEDGGNTTNECVFTYIQAEFGKQKALYISPNLVSCTFLKIHSERATSKDGVPAWVLGPAAYSSVRLNSMNRLGRCEIVAQYGKITGLKPENVRVAVNSTGGTFSIEDGQFSQGIEAASGSNGMVSLTSCSGYYHNVTQNWYLNKCAAEEVNVGACPDGYWPVLDHCRVNALRRTDDTAAVEVCGGRVEALRDGQWREIRITTNARVALEGGARSLSQCKLTLDATSKIVGNLTLTTVGFRFAGRIEGNLTLQGIRQTLFAAPAEVTGTATNVGPPEGDSYLDGSPDGTWCKNIRPVILGAALASYTINDTSGVPRTVTTGGRYTIPAWIKAGGVWTPQTAATGT